MIQSGLGFEFSLQAACLAQELELQIARPQSIQHNVQHKYCLQNTANGERRNYCWKNVE